MSYPKTDAARLLDEVCRQRAEDRIERAAQLKLNVGAQSPNYMGPSAEREARRAAEWRSIELTDADVMLLVGALYSCNMPREKMAHASELARRLLSFI